MTFPFVRDGYVHHLVERDELVCLVERVHQRSGSVHWEVVRLNFNRPWTTHCGRQMPARESYPPVTAWGKSGWTYTTLGEAQARFASEVLRESARIYGVPRSKRGGISLGEGQPLTPPEIVAVRSEGA